MNRYTLGNGDNNERLVDAFFSNFTIDFLDDVTNMKEALTVDHSTGHDSGEMKRN